MLIQNYIAKDFPIYNLSTSAKEALFDAQSFEFSHIFVQKNGIFQGAIGKEFLEENQEKSLGDLLIYSERFAILYESTILESIKLFHIFNANVIPVINENEEYQGYIAWDSIVCELSKYPLFSEQGALLMVEVARKNYTMVEISQIVEQNYGKLYGAFINEINDNFVRITMRISSENLTSIGETFERYGYTIIQKFYNDEKEELLKNRYQFMQKYLEY